MSPFRLFSINARALAVIVTTCSCASLSGSIYRQAEVQPFETIQSYVTPHDKSLRSIVGARDPMDADPHRVFDYYCSKGRGQRNIETTIRAVLPRLPKGVPIDSASNAQQQIYQYFRTIAKNFYQLSAYEDLLDGKKLPESRFNFALKNPTFDSFINLAKESRSDEKIPLGLMSIHGNNTLLLGAMRLPVFSRVSYSGSEKGLFQWRESDGTPASYWAIELVFPKRPIFDDQGQKIFPLYPALPFEISFFQKHFTMLIPPDTQKQMFDGKKFYIRDDGSFDLGAAAERRRALWEAYAASQTSIKEAQTDDPQIVDFHVRLDINLFCRYGRVVKDLLTD